MNYDALASRLCGVIEEAVIELKNDPVTLRMALNLPHNSYPHEIKRVLESLLNSYFRAPEVLPIKKFIADHPEFYSIQLKKAGQEFLGYAYDMRHKHG